MKTIIVCLSLGLVSFAASANENQLSITAKTTAAKVEGAAPTRILKAGESYLLTACAEAGDHPNADEQINQVLAKGKIIEAGTEIDPPYLVSAPGVGSAGNANAGWAWCTTVTVTKQ